MAIIKLPQMSNNFTLKWAIPVMALSTQLFNSSCNNGSTTTTTTTTTTTDSMVRTDSYDSTFNVEAQSFADLQLLRYQVPGFNGLSLQQKKLSYYLYEAALCGRDIIYDQKSKYGILLRKTLEAVYGSYKG